MKRIGLVCAFALTALTIWTSVAAAAEVREWDLPAGDLGVYSIVLGADGDLWIGGMAGEPRKPASEQQSSGFVARVAPNGNIRQFAVPGYYVESLAPAPGGGAWAADSKGVQLIGEQGEVAQVAGPLTASGSSLALGSDGNVWRTTGFDSGLDSIDRITPTGEVTSFPLPRNESGPGEIALGPDGNLWFTEYFQSRIGRITTSGALSEFPVRVAPNDIAVGSDGNLWFVSYQGVGRITLTGAASYFLGLGGDAIAAGPDGRLWLGGSGTGRLDRIDPSGHRSSVALDRPQAYPRDLITGPDGALWFVALPEGPCHGGGLTCSQQIQYAPAIVGRVTVGPLSAAPATATAKASRRHALLPIACREGRAGEMCRGDLTLTAQSSGGRRVVLGSSALLQPTDTTRRLILSFNAAGRRMLAHRHRVRAVLTVELEGGVARTRPLELVLGH